MLIKSLNEMEAIVEDNNALSWNGQKRYEPGANGWDIPKRLVRTNEQQG